MRLPLPPRPLRRRVLDLLTDAYEHEDIVTLRLAFAELAAHYDVRCPLVRWVDRPYAARGALGLYRQTKRPEVILVRPARWAARRSENTAEEWTAVALHEAYHVLVSDAEEEKADDYSERFVG